MHNQTIGTRGMAGVRRTVLCEQKGLLLEDNVYCGCYCLVSAGHCGFEDTMFCVTRSPSRLGSQPHLPCKEKHGSSSGLHTASG